MISKKQVCVYLFSSLFLVGVFSGCGSSNSSSPSPTNSKTSANNTTSSTTTTNDGSTGATGSTGAPGATGPTGAAAIANLQLTPNPASVVAGGELQFGASGGVAPYTYGIVLGGGSISSSGLFTAPSSAGSVEIGAQDSAGSSVFVIVAVTAAPSSPVSSTAICTDSASCSALIGALSDLAGFGSVASINAWAACISKGFTSVTSFQVETVSGSGSGRKNHQKKMASWRSGVFQDLLFALDGHGNYQVITEVECSNN